MPIFNKLQVNEVSSGGDPIQYDVMPEANIENLDKIVQYVGGTNLEYINGYFYKCVEYIPEGSGESGSGSGESGGSGSSEFEEYCWERVDVQPPFVIDRTDKYRSFYAKYGWSFNTGFGELTLYTVKENPEEGDILYQAESFAVPGITLKSATTGLVVPYCGWVKVAKYLPADNRYPDRILITVGGVTPLIPNTNNYTEPMLFRVTQ